MKGGKTMVFPAWAGMNRYYIKLAFKEEGCSPRGRG